MVLLGIKSGQYHFLCRRLPYYQKIRKYGLYCSKGKGEYMKQSNEKRGGVNETTHPNGAPIGENQLYRTVKRGELLGRVECSFRYS